MGSDVPGVLSDTRLSAAPCMGTARDEGWGIQAVEAFKPLGDGVSGLEPKHYWLASKFSAYLRSGMSSTLLNPWS